LSRPQTLNDYEPPLGPAALGKLRTAHGALECEADLLFGLHDPTPYSDFPFLD